VLRPTAEASVRLGWSEQKEDFMATSWHLTIDCASVAIGFDDYELNPADAVSLESSTPHRLYNIGSESVHAIWFVLGPQRVDAAAPSMHRDPDDA
jgi:hypothetical protein